MSGDQTSVTVSEEYEKNKTRLGESLKAIRQELRDADALGLLSRDPATWDRLLVELPSLADLEERIYAGEFADAEELVENSAETLRGILLEIDEEFGKRGLPRPLAAYLFTRPYQESVEWKSFEHLAAYRFDDDMPKFPLHVQGWTARVLELTEELFARQLLCRRQLQLVFEGKPVPGISRNLARNIEKHSALLSIAAKEDIHKHSSFYWGVERLRGEWTRWIGTSGTVRAWLYAMGRALQDEPETREALVVHLWHWIKDLRMTLFGDAFMQDPIPLLRVPLDHPDRAILETRLLEFHRKCRTKVGRMDRIEALDRRIEESLALALGPADLAPTLETRHRMRLAFHDLVGYLVRHGRREAARSLIRAHSSRFPGVDHSAMVDR